MCKIIVIFVPLITKLPLSYVLWSPFYFSLHSLALPLWLFDSATSSTLLKDHKFKIQIFHGLRLVKRIVWQSFTFTYEFPFFPSILRMWIFAVREGWAYTVSFTRVVTTSPTRPSRWRRFPGALILIQMFQVHTFALRF